MKIGRYEILSVQTGTFRLDGGAMFGVVPKTLWRSKTDADEDNRIPLATRTLVAIDRAAGRVIIVDTGCGTKWDVELRERFAIRHDRDAVDRRLRTVGLTAADVTDVIVTHLHFDHNGDLTEWEDPRKKTLRLRFPKATHWLHHRQWEHAHKPTLKDRASYFPEDYELVHEAGLLRLLDGEPPESPWPDVELFVSNGHTVCHLHPIFGTSDERILWTGDAIPTTAHLPLPWVMAYDLRPLQTIEEKQWMLAQCTDRRTYLAFPHDPQVAAAELDVSSGKAIILRKLDL